MPKQSTIGFYQQLACHLQFLAKNQILRAFSCFHEIDEGYCLRRVLKEDTLPKALLPVAEAEPGGLRMNGAGTRLGAAPVVIAGVEVLTDSAEPHHSFAVMHLSSEVPKAMCHPRCR